MKLWRRSFLLQTSVAPFLQRRPIVNRPDRNFPITHYWWYGGYYTNPWELPATELDRYDPNHHPMLEHHEWAK